MANSLTNKGREYALFGSASDGSIARLATRLKLMHSSSVPSIAGTGFVQVAAGNGYPTNGWAITIASWTLVSSPRSIRLADQLVTAVGGSVAGVAGAWIEDASGNVLVWWERSAITLSPGDTLPLDDLTVG